ncbi:hypothetical protein [Streptomyces sp. NRRL S-1314]|uniref:tetratricopeptide repeat protein n=1 Tax=Streptomyces TaxID=1883 RepID=UPI00131E4EE5|nr:hypothetical protein [Streptomyces sp. NRRL S-1314]
MGQQAMADQLCALRKAALNGSGRSLRQAIRIANERTAQTDMKPLNSSTVNDWFNGGTTPHDFDRVWALVEVLLEWGGAPDRTTQAGRGWWAARKEAWKALCRQAQPQQHAQLSESAVSRRKLGVPIASVDPIEYLEVHPAIGAEHSLQGKSTVDPLPKYVEREHDQRLRKEIALAQQRSRLMVLVGGSSTGKTRALWQAIKQLPNGWRVWRPADRSALLSGLQQSQSLSRTVVWLNEMQRYLLPYGQPDQDGQAASALFDLLAHPDRGPVVIVGTLWHEHYTTLTRQPSDADTADPHQQARALLKGATVTVPEAFTTDDLAKVSHLADDDARLAEALRGAGARITQYLAGARELVHRYENAPPEARAILIAAADAHRLGLGDEIPASFLQTAAAAYLDPGHWYAQTDTWRATWFTRALDYTSQPCRGVPGPLGVAVPPPGQAPSDYRAYRLADYLQQHITDIRQHMPPPAGFWEAADNLPSATLLTALAQAAEDRLRLQIASRLYRAAADLGDATASLRLAELWQACGAYEIAEVHYEEAVEAGVTSACTRLAELRERRGDHQAAEQLARQSGETWAITLLAERRKNSENEQDVERLLREAADAGDSGAVVRLIDLWQESGDLRKAEQLCRDSIAAGHVWVWRNLISLLVDAGDHQGAEVAAHEAADSGWPSTLSQLAEEYEKRGDSEGAMRLYREADMKGDLMAVSNAVVMLERAGDIGRATALARRAVEDPELTWMRGQLAELLVKSGDREGAEQIYREAVADGQKWALTGLAKLLASGGDREGAERLYREAFSHGQKWVLVELAKLQEAAGTQQQITAFYRRIIDSGQTWAVVELTGLPDDPGERRYRPLPGLARALGVEETRLRRYGLEADGQPAKAWW